MILNCGAREAQVTLCSNKGSTNTQIHSDMEMFNLFSNYMNIFSPKPNECLYACFHIWMFFQIWMFFSGLLKQAVSLNSKVSQILRKSTPWVLLCIVYSYILFLEGFMINQQIEGDKTQCYIAIIQSYYKVCSVRYRVLSSVSAFVSTSTVRWWSPGKYFHEYYMSVVYASGWVLFGNSLLSRVRENIPNSLDFIIKLSPYKHI